MLKQLWSTRERKPNHTPEQTPNAGEGPDRPQNLTENPQQPALTIDEGTPSDSFTPSRFLDPFPGEDATGAFPSIEGYLLGSFMPGVADFSTPGFDGAFAQQYPSSGGFQDWGL